MLRKAEKKGRNFQGRPGAAGLGRGKATCRGARPLSPTPLPAGPLESLLAGHSALVDRTG